MTNPKNRAGRRPLPFDIKWANEIPIWDAAQVVAETQPDAETLIQLGPFPSKGHAVAKMHRLNGCRVAKRNMAGEEIVDWDGYIIRIIAEGDKGGSSSIPSVHFVLLQRRPRFDYSNLRDGEGRPVRESEIEAYRERQTLRRFTFDKDDLADNVLNLEEC